jgi:hypothetical protein
VLIERRLQNADMPVKGGRGNSQRRNNDDEAIRLLTPIQRGGMTMAYYW